MSRSTLDGTPSAAGATRRGAALLRALLPSVPTGRHTWDFLANAGGRPRTAFAIILSL